LSGIVGIFERAGAPVAAAQLRPLVDSLKHLGPDAKDIWAEGSAGLGHALLQTGGFSSPVFSIAESHLCLTADGHLVSRAQLRTELLSTGAQISPNAGDDELLLHAYAQWGPDCVEHLRGDFAFAIWDAQAQTLFCARDHFGIKPFYYALFDSLFLFSNALNALRLHPRVSPALNDSAVADFLLFGLNCDNSTTTFRDIQRLPPAHSLLVSRDAVKLRRYWDVPVDRRIRCTRADEYVENFLAAWNPAVADCLDASPTGIFLSGGLDSAAVAATANCIQRGRAALAHPPESCDLRAYTILHGHLARDRDPAHAAQLAAALQMPLQHIYMDNVQPFDQFISAQPIAPEPVDDPLFAGLFLSFQEIAAHCRVALSGEGSDNLMHFKMWPYVADLRCNADWRRLLRELSQYAWRRPFPWRGLLVRLQGLFGKGETAARPFPKWIAPDFAKRLDLPARWRAGQPRPAPPQRHPIHPAAHASLYLPQWTRMFELENPGVTKCPVELRYPFLDLRVVEYLLAIPPFPWFFQKTLLRRAMAGLVLDSVRLRPKTPFVADPLLLQLQRFGSFGVKTGADAGVSAAVSAAVSAIDTKAAPGDRSSGGEADLYINHSSLLPLHGKMTAEQVNQMARPICFNFWLQSVRQVGYN
jgi:asparagine synthase (glutamine-hydrolysing)